MLCYNQEMQKAPSTTSAVDATTIESFRHTVIEYYRANARHMPWREDTQPYFVLVSEIMLQQTQVSRVLPKFAAFVQRFPTAQALAAAPLADVITAWMGLGYNRRARFLHEAAKKVCQEYAGVFPASINELMSLPGVGINTAGAIMAYAFNQPALYIETNVRTVYMHHFFAGIRNVTDKDIMSVLAASIDTKNPREWYWALMDYGSHLKATQPSNNAQSKHYKKQSRFAGSARQIRGQILRLVMASPITLGALEMKLSDARVSNIVSDLLNDGLIEQRDNDFYLTGQGQVS